MADIWSYIGEWQTAIEFKRFGYELAKKSGQRLLESIFAYGLASLFYKTRKHKESETMCKLCLDIGEQLPQALKLNLYIDTLQLMGLMERKRNFRRAFDLFVQSLEYQEALEKVSSQTRYKKADIFVNMGNTFYLDGVFDEAIKFFQDALRIFDEYGNVHGRARVFANMGNILMRKENFDECIHSYKEAEYLFSETGNLFEYSLILRNLAIAFHKNGMRKNAKEYANKAKELYDILEDKSRAKKVREFIEMLE